MFFVPLGNLPAVVRDKYLKSLTVNRQHQKKMKRELMKSQL